MPEDDIAKEIESDDLYKSQYLNAKVKATDLINPVINNKEEGVASILEPIQKDT